MRKITNLKIFDNKFDEKSIDDGNVDEKYCDDNGYKRMKPL